MDTCLGRVTTVRQLIQIRQPIIGSLDTHATSIFQDPNVTKHMFYLDVVVFSDKVQNNIRFAYE